MIAWTLCPTLPKYANRMQWIIGILIDNTTALESGEFFKYGLCSVFYFYEKLLNLSQLSGSLGLTASDLFLNKVHM